MSANVFDFRVFQSVRDKARTLGNNVAMAMIRKVREEQRQGNSGNAVLGEVNELRRRFTQGWEPPKGSAA
jgi:hypothetical protein